MKILISIVSLSISSASFAQAPTECFKMATKRERDGGLVVEGYNRGKALRLNKNEALILCRGTRTSEAPVACTLMAQERKKLNGLNLNQADGIRLCAGTDSMEATKDCFVKATNSDRDGGLELNDYDAIKLCRKYKGLNH